MNTKTWTMGMVLVLGSLVASVVTATPIYIEDFNVAQTGWWVNSVEGDSWSTSSSGNGNPDGTPCLHMVRGTTPGALEMLASDTRHDWPRQDTWIPVNDFGFNWNYQAQVYRSNDSAAYPSLLVYIQYADLSYGVYDLTPGIYRPDYGVWTDLSGTVNDTKKIAWIYAILLGGEAMRVNDVVNADNIVINPLPEPVTLILFGLVGAGMVNRRRFLRS